MKATTLLFMEDLRLLKDDLKLKWRNTPSYYDENTNSIQAFQTLIASFLEDRHSNSLLSKKIPYIFINSSIYKAHNYKM